MAAPDLELLHHLIDQAVHVNGPLGKTTAPGLNALLHRLTTDLYAAAGGAPPVDLPPDATKADLVDGKILISQLPTRAPYAIQDNAGVVAAVTAGTYANGELQAGSADYGPDRRAAGCGRRPHCERYLRARILPAGQRRAGLGSLDKIRRHSPDGGN